MQSNPRALTFACEGDWLHGVLDLPAPSIATATRGVLVVVGGPQYRAGSHRQFTLLARSLAAGGVPAMRFDYRGMGDSEGEARSFDSIAADVHAAIDAFFVAVPGLREVVLWGLCDGASAAMLYAGADPRVTGLVLLNPWARSEQGLAKATLKHYYAARLLDPGLWKKIVSGRFDVRGALASLGKLLGSARGKSGADAGAWADTNTGADTGARGKSLPEQLHDGVSRFNGHVLLITSSADLTAQEFLTVTAAPQWQPWLKRPTLTHQRLAGADHTCSRHTWREQVTLWTAAWLASW